LALFGHNGLLLNIVQLGNSLGVIPQVNLQPKNGDKFTVKQMQHEGLTVQAHMLSAFLLRTADEIPLDGVCF